MRRILAFGLIALIACLSAAGKVYAQSPTPPTPTTRILAIGTLNPGVDPAAARAILPTEVRETVKLYLDGKIDQWYSLQGRPGVAFILNVTDPAAAHEMLEKLPLGQAHLMSFELIPLAPLNPLRQLQGMTTGSP
jgi:Muconolactone delta-isomerase